MLLTTLLVLAAPVLAQNDATLPQGSRWAEEATIYFYVNPTNTMGFSDDMVEEVVLDAVDTWNGAGAGIEFKYMGFNDATANETSDQVNVIWFSDDWSWDSDLVAVASPFVSGLEIIGFDIALNAADYDWSLDGNLDAMDLPSVLTHELGHALGLPHTDQELATMYEEGGPGETYKRDLRDDDTRALMGLYPPATVSCATVAPSHISGLGLLFALGALLRRNGNKA